MARKPKRDWSKTKVRINLSVDFLDLGRQPTVGEELEIEPSGVEPWRELGYLTVVSEAKPTPKDPSSQGGKEGEKDPKGDTKTE